MNERFTAMTDDELGRALSRAVDWPVAPALNVAGRIREIDQAATPIRPTLSLRTRRRTVLILVAAALAVAAAAAAAKLVIDLGAVTIKVVPTAPTNLPTIAPSGSAYGSPVATVHDAEIEAGLTATVPATLGTPDEVWVDVPPEGARIVLAWRARPDLPAIEGQPWGAILYEFRGDATLDVKTLVSATNTLRATKVGTHEAYFLTGPHEIDLLNAEGRFVRYRVAGNVLLWQSGDLTLRLETELKERAAVRVAESSSD